MPLANLLSSCFLFCLFVTPSLHVGSIMFVFSETFILLNTNIHLRLESNQGFSHIAIFVFVNFCVPRVKFKNLNMHSAEN